MSKAKRSAFWLTGLGLVVGLVLATPGAVHAVAAALVQVTNTTANPVITSRMDDPGRIPYQSEAEKPQICGVGCQIDFPIVPANHRLVIQHVSVNGGTNGIGVVQAILRSSSGSENSSFFVPMALTAANEYNYALDEPVLFFQDSGEAPIVYVYFYGGSATDNVISVTLSGYLLDCAAAPCSPIAH